MSKSLLAMAAGAALIVGATAANADPLALTDDQMDQVTAAGFAFAQGTLALDVHQNVASRVDIAKRKFIQQRVDVSGFFADSLAGANCHGAFGCQALTHTVTDVGPGYASSVSASESATGTPFFFKAK